MNSDGIFLYPTYLLMGLLGGFGHCLGMCGPLVLTWTSGGLAGPWALLEYNLGRVFSYFCLGLFVSFAGSGIVSGLYGVQSVVMGLLGALMVLGALAVIFPSTPRWFPQVVPSKVVKAFIQRGPFPLGLVNGFFPCGLVYTALIGAVTSGVEAKNPIVSAINGALLMAVFGTGTSLSLFLLGYFSGLISHRYRNFFYKLSGILMLSVGGLFLWKAIN